MPTHRNRRRTVKASTQNHRRLAVLCCMFLVLAGTFTSLALSLAATTSSTSVQFYVSPADVASPEFTNITPAPNAGGVVPSANVVFRVTDGGLGVDIAATTVTINGVLYSTGNGGLSYTGTTADYTVTVDPSADFEAGSVVSVVLRGQDLAVIPNTVSLSYTFTVGSSSDVSDESGGNSRGTSRFAGVLPSADSLEEHGAAKSKRHRYRDVPPGVWYEDAVSSLLDLKVLDRSQLRFRGGDFSSRAEIVKVLVEVRGGMTQETLPPRQFDDIRPDAWYARYVEFAGTHGWLLGDGNCIGTHPCMVMPDSTVTRAEAVAMVVRAFGLGPTGSAEKFRDVPDGAWYGDIIHIAADHCIIRGSGDDHRAHPEEGLNRAEMAVIIDRAQKNLAFGNDCAGYDDGKAESGVEERRQEPLTFASEQGSQDFATATDEPEVSFTSETAPQKPPELRTPSPTLESQPSTASLQTTSTDSDASSSRIGIMTAIILVTVGVLAVGAVFVR